MYIILRINSIQTNFSHIDYGHYDNLRKLYWTFGIWLTLFSNRYWEFYDLFRHFHSQVTICKMNCFGDRKK